MKNSMARILLLVVVVVLGSCQGQKPENEDRLNEAYKNIDQGNYDGAIAKLEDLKQSDPRPEVRTALASAYAARAGVFMQHFRSFLKTLDAPPINDSTIEESTSFKKNKERINALSSLLSTDERRELELLVRSMAGFELYKARLETLPYVPVNRRGDLDRAIQALSGIDTQGSHLYRGLLNLAFLRSELADGFTDWAEVEKDLRVFNFQNLKDRQNQVVLCGIQRTFEGFQIWLDGQFNRVKVIANDVRVAFPSKTEETLAFDSKVSLLQGQISVIGRAQYRRSCQ